MPISSYFDEKLNKTFFRVRHSKSSSVIKGIRVDRRIDGIETEKEAEKIYSKLMVQLEREIMEAEAKGFLWSKLVEDWELAARAGNIFIRQLSKAVIYDYVVIIRQWTQEWMDLHVAEIDRARAWMVLDRIEREKSIARRKRLRTAGNPVWKNQRDYDCSYGWLPLHQARGRENARDFKPRADSHPSHLREKLEPSLVSYLVVSSFYGYAFRRTVCP